MVRRDEDSGPGQPRSRPQQNISSIAHLFFDNQEGDSSTGETFQVKQLLVLGSGQHTHAPYTAAGLGQHLLDQSSCLAPGAGGKADEPLRQVYLGEPSPVFYSATSQLESQTYRELLPEESVPWAGRGHHLAGVRLFPGPVPGEDFSGGLGDGLFTIRHMDLPDERMLQALETKHCRGHETSLPRDGRDALIWCVDESQCRSFALVSRVGRLLRLVNPRFLQLLVFEGNSASGATRETSNALLDRATQLLRFVGQDLDVRGHWVGSSVAERNQMLSSLARRLSL